LFITSLLSATGSRGYQWLALDTSELKITIPVPNGWLPALPGPLTSFSDEACLRNGLTREVACELDRQLHKNREEIAQMYAQAGRLDHFLLKKLITGQEVPSVLNLHGSIYAGNGDGPMIHLAGPALDPGPVMVISPRSGSAIAAGPEIEGVNFRPSISVSISEPMEQYHRGEPKLPDNTAELITFHLRDIRRIIGNRLTDVGQRKAEELAGLLFVGIPIACDRGGLPLHQYQWHRKKGNLHIQIEATAASLAELENLKQQVGRMRIEESSSAQN
jgi:hypothetical protein